MLLFFKVGFGMSLDLELGRDTFPLHKEILGQVWVGEFMTSLES